MANLQLYSLLYVTVEGKLLVEEGSVEVDRDPKNQVVETVAKGVSGVSPGAGQTSIRVTNAVPAADFELNAGPFMKGIKPAEIGVVGPGGKQLKVACFFMGDSLKHSTNNPSSYEFNLLGPFADWE